MDRKETIRHEGIVEHVGANNCRVRIQQAAACSSCTARQLCRSSESKEKVIELRGYYPTLQVGDTVILSGSVRQGLLASVLAYAVPLIFMLVALFAGTLLSGENTGVLAALLVLVLYYCVLYLLRDKLGKEFAFSLTLPERGSNKGNNK